MKRIGWTGIAGLLLLACLGFGAARPAYAVIQSADVVSSPALYLLGSFGGHFLDNGDINSFFGQSIYGNQFYTDWDLHLGVQFPEFFALEGSVVFGPYRSYSANLSGNSATVNSSNTNWNLTTYSVIPALTLVSGNPFITDSTGIYFLGLRLGLANLNTSVSNQYPTLPSSSSGQQVQTYDIGVVLRIEEILFDHFSVGLQGGYDWTRFNNVANLTGSSGNAVADFSGWHADLVIGLWTNSPYRATPVVRTSAVVNTAAVDAAAGSVSATASPVSATATPAGY